MTDHRLALSAFALLGSMLGSVACGDSDGSSFDEFGASSRTEAHPNGSVVDSEEKADEGVTASSACVTSSAAAQLLPAHLVFMFDRSDSMEKLSKWTSCSTGLKAFFADPATTGLEANATSFASKIEATRLKDGTPTLPAVNGALQYAKKVQGAHPGERTVVVLVTDGLPTSCDSTVSNVADALKAAVSEVPTYVIGVGPELQNLNELAVAGGTGKAILVSAQTQEQTSSDFQKALGEIRAQAISCEYALPAAPLGQTLDSSKVNVAVSQGGASTTLAYDPACARGEAWRYDDPAKPSKISMCATACDALKKNGTSKVELLFGCAAQGSAIR